MIRGLLIGVLLLLAGVVIGYASSPKAGTEAYGQGVYQTLNDARLRPAFFARLEFRRILFNNSHAAAAIELGFVTFGAYGGFILLANGIKIGGLYRMALAGNVPSSFWLMHVLPHGVIEYSSFLMAQAVAIKGGGYLWKLFTEKPTEIKWKVIIMAFACFPILALAAWVEVYITPFL